MELITLIESYQKKFVSQWLTNEPTNEPTGNKRTISNFNIIRIEK